MKKINFSIGSFIYYKNEQHEILKNINLTSVLIQNIETQEKLIANINTLSTSKNENNNESEKINSSYESIPQKYWEEAKKKYEIIKPFINKNDIKQELIEYSKGYNIHHTTIYRWLKNYESSNTLLSLVPQTYTRGGKGKTRLNKDIELIINKSINELYLSKQKYDIEKVHMHIKKECRNANLTPPHYNTIRNRIKKLPDKKILASRESLRVAKRQYDDAPGVFPEGDYPLDVIQIDHTPMDIIIVDETYRKPIGRPYLTIAIDIYSRMITGFYIALQEPSYFSVSQCLANSILPKEQFLRNLDIEGEWLVYGIPKTIHLDNGPDFRSNALQQTCENYNISIDWRPVARPQFGGHIERLIGTSMREVHSLPGTTFSNIKQRGEYNSDKEATMTLLEIEKWICEYIVNIYHKKIHSGIEMLPLKKYEIGILGDEYTIGKGLPEKIEDEDSFKISLLPHEKRTIQHNGVSFNKITYYSDCLRRWIKAKDEDGKMRKFIFKYDLRDISTIWFYDPDIQEYFPVTYRNIGLPPISFWELREIKSSFKEKHIKDYNENEIFIAYDRLHKIKEDAALKTKSARKMIEAKKINIKKIQQTNSSKIKKEIEISTTESIDDIFKDIKPFDDINIGKL